LNTERELKTWGVGAVGSVWEKGESFTTVKSREGVYGLYWKPFRLRDFGEVDAN